jgi:hypothetical protein
MKHQCEPEYWILAILGLPLLAFGVLCGLIWFPIQHGFTRVQHDLKAVLDD